MYNKTNVFVHNGNVLINKPKNGLCISTSEIKSEIKVYHACLSSDGDIVSRDEALRRFNFWHPRSIKLQQDRVFAGFDHQFWYLYQLRRLPTGLEKLVIGVGLTEADAKLAADRLTEFLMGPMIPLECDDIKNRQEKI